MSFVDKDCSDDECLLNIVEMSFNHKGNGMYEVSGTVVSKGQVVKRLNDTLSRRDEYVTQRVTIMLQCSTDPTTSVSTPPQHLSNQIVVISAVGTVTPISIAVLVLLLCLIMKFRSVHLASDYTFLLRAMHITALLTY